MHDLCFFQVQVSISQRQSKLLRTSQKLMLSIERESLVYKKKSKRKNDKSIHHPEIHKICF
jgi:hypothetical protein